MKRRVLTLLTVVGVCFAASVHATDVGVSINIGQPGFYGQIDIGNAPQPRLIYAKPVMVESGHRHSGPVYLRVSPGHEKDWRKHCKHYNACGQNVYFVRDDWYRDEYVPHHRENGHGGKGHGKGHGHGKDKNKHKDND